jgi:glycosyltransferase involved in cell wall biosynthesis
MGEGKIRGAASALQASGKDACLAADRGVARLSIEDHAARAGRRPRVLVLSWNYPTPAAPQRGLWVERMCEAASAEADVRVIVPTPWVPPLVPSLSRFRSVPARERRGPVALVFPRVPGSIEYLTHAYDARLALPAVRAAALRMHRERPFDLIHAHFIYPDGVVASRIGRELGVPVMTSEHSFWTPWLEDRPSVGRQVRAALPGIDLVAPVSGFLERSIRNYAGDSIRHMIVLPNVVDDAIFHTDGGPRDADELLFVGLIRRFKRVDVLLRALAEVRKQRPAIRLRILAAKALNAYAADRREIDNLIDELGLRSAVTIVEGADPPAVAEAMRRCTLVVVSSGKGRETFCSVAAEALACGAPLVTTRCGGPEEFVGRDDGVMVEPDDPSALAAGILDALERRSEFREREISNRIITRFGREAWCKQAIATYLSLVAAHG